MSLLLADLEKAVGTWVSCRTRPGDGFPSLDSALIQAARFRIAVEAVFYRHPTLRRLSLANEPELSVNSWLSDRATSWQRIHRTG